ncbi:hypothetical protein [Actinomadura parmotrematis]|uniref:Uncharacterized protein n=1 Tax=Actinomadura parmotrematis TaxID=2864039 RepID=A0ABS7FZ92_9ACTN|nr:hypothetical protein [Actinomadura parmotrematis]MBW8485748.1 hypothetical protein [Actinomadura parmotrematis]
MEGIIALVVVALLAAFCIRWAMIRMHLNPPARNAILVVFVLVVLALWGQHLNG